MKVLLDGSGSEYFMTYYRPVNNAQGLAIFCNRAFVMHDTGVCAVLDLSSKDPRPISVFPLGSYNSGKPSREYLNHANSCMFGATHWQNNPIPLLYVTIGSGTGSDEDGYFYRCAVENIQQRQDGSFFSETVQTICYRPDRIPHTEFESPSWGCPCFLVDNDAGFLYIFSARYRTKRGCTPVGKDNAFIITKFNLPDPTQGGMIYLGPEDILDQFCVPSDVLFTQGGTIYNSKLYYTFGCPQSGYPLRILAFDLQRKTLCAQVENLTEAFRGEEIECCGIYKDRLICNTCNGNLFLLEEGIIELT